GTRDALDQREALSALREAGLFVTRLSPVASSGARLPRQTPIEYSNAAASSSESGSVAVENIPGASASEFGRRRADDVALASPIGFGVKAPASGHDLWAHANAKDLSLFFRQMHSMIHSGTSISRALQVYAEHAPNKSLGRAARQMSRETGESRPMSETMRAFPGLFSVLAISMIGAGERGGFLDQMCLRLAEYCERDYELAQNVKRETLYPKILLVAAILIPPIVTLVMNGVEAYLRQVVPPLAIIGLAYMTWRIINRTMLVTGREGAFRLTLDAIKIHIPVVSKVVRSLATAKFSRALGAMYASGVGAEHAMRIAGESCGNAYVARRVEQVTPALSQGASFTQSMIKTGQFPPIAIQMMATGEESGAIDTQLDKVADFLEAEAETAIRAAVKIMGVLVFLLMAAYIGSIVAKFYTGYGSQVQGLINEVGG
ncbi:MAG TPA: type II secretion system F family protein, partial [Abditibacteriaceae bacterium]|nr:type II secretion system F family protein [Abditibacteriaceae bacterium]